VCDVVELGGRVLVIAEGLRIQPLQRGIGGISVDEQGTQHPRDGAENLALGRRDPKIEPTSARPLDERSPHAQRSFCIVAHSPCACRRDTSNSHRSRGPVETTARPLWCTSSISLVAFSLGKPNSFWNTYTT